VSGESPKGVETLLLWRRRGAGLYILGESPKGVETPRRGLDSPPSRGTR